MGDEVTNECWLVLKPEWRDFADPNGDYPVVGFAVDRSTKRRPALGRDEVACKVVLRVPTTAFTRPRFEATITVPEEAIVSPESIEADVVVDP